MFAQGGDNVDELAALARDEGLALRFIASPGRLRTCTSIIEASPVGGHRVTELVEPSSAVDQACVAQMDQVLASLLPSANALVIAGSMAPGFPSDYQAKLAALARAAGASDGSCPASGAAGAVLVVAVGKWLAHRQARQAEVIEISLDAPDAAPRGKQGGQA